MLKFAKNVKYGRMDLPTDGRTDTYRGASEHLKIYVILRNSKSTIQQTLILRQLTGKRNKEEQIADDP